MKSNYRKLGEFIQLRDKRNINLITEELLGISIDKEYMPSVANVIGTDLTKYKIIEKNVFACNPMHVGRDEKLPVALYKGDNPAIVSPAYFVFEIIDRSILNEEYLMMWFRRSEFDRNCWFKTDGSVRGGISWNEICELELLVPDIEKQKSTVKAYKNITNRIILKQQINDNLEAAAMALFKSWFEDFEPFDKDDTGKPNGWLLTTLETKVTTSAQSVNPQKLKQKQVWHYSIPAFDSERLPISDEPSTILSNKYYVPDNSILVSKLNPDTKRIWRTLNCFENAICSTEFIVFNAIQESHRAFYCLLFNTKQFIDFLVSNSTGSTNSRMRVKPASSLDFEFLAATDDIIEVFCQKVEPLLAQIDNNLLEIRELSNLIPIAVAKMMSSSR